MCGTRGVFLRREEEKDNLCDHSLSSEELHAQQGKDHDEEEQEEEQTDDGLHGVQEGNDKVPQRVPVSDRKQETQTEERKC